MTMKVHPHPGIILRQGALEPLNLSVSDAARRLGMSRVALSRMLNGRSGISADLAIRRELASVSTARFWLALQMNYDLTKARSHRQPPVTRLAAA